MLSKISIKLFYSLIFAIAILSNSCMPSREEALEYYENILRITHPVNSNSVEVIALLFVYTEDYLKKDQKTDTIRKEAIRKSNENLLRKTEEGKTKLAGLSFTSYGSKLKTAAENYLHRMEVNHKLIADSIIPQLMKENRKEQKDKILEEYDYAIKEYREMNLEFIEAKLLFEKDNNLYDFDREEIEKKIDESK